MKKYYLLLTIATIFFSCESKNHTAKRNTGDQLFESAKLLSDEEYGSKVLKSNNLDALKVYERCKKDSISYSLLPRFIRAVFYESNQKYFEKYKDLEWNLLRFPINEFSNILYYHKEPFHKTFMDIGSGNGDKLYMALLMGFEKAYGVEYEEKLHLVAEEVLKPLSHKGLVEINNADATKLDDTYYKKADFIYMYCPLILNLPEQGKLMNRLIRNMRDKTMIYEAGFVYAKELNQYFETSIPDGYRGFLMIKKENNKWMYKIFIKEWTEMRPK